MWSIFNLPVFFTTYTGKIHSEQVRRQLGGQYPSLASKSLSGHEVFINLQFDLPSETEKLQINI